MPSTRREAWQSQTAARQGHVVLSGLEEPSSDSNPIHHGWVLNRILWETKHSEASFIRKRLNYGLCCINRQVIGEQPQLSGIHYSCVLTALSWAGKGRALQGVRCVFRRVSLFFFFLFGFQKQSVFSLYQKAVANSDQILHSDISQYRCFANTCFWKVASRF